MKHATNGLPPIHPGEYTREALDELGLTQAALASALGVSPMRVSHLLKSRPPCTAELALRLGRALGQSPRYWLNLQAAYHLRAVQAAMPDSLAAVREIVRDCVACCGCARRLRKINGISIRCLSARTYPGPRSAFLQIQLPFGVLRWQR